MSTAHRAFLFDILVHYLSDSVNSCMYCTFLSRVLRLDDPGQAKVCYFAVQGLIDQNVSCTYVSVDVVLLLDVRHAFGYLSYRN